MKKVRALIIIKLNEEKNLKKESFCAWVEEEKLSFLLGYFISKQKKLNFQCRTFCLAFFLSLFLGPRIKKMLKETEIKLEEKKITAENLIKVWSCFNNQ